jgi:hypothetical protein
LDRNLLVPSRRATKLLEQTRLGRANRFITTLFAILSICSFESTTNRTKRFENMESLLHWGITNSSANADGAGASTSAGITERKDLDPAIIDHILGRPDAELMKEALAQAQDASLPDDARVQALDDLEMVCTSAPSLPSDRRRLNKSSLNTLTTPLVCAHVGEYLPALTR